MVEVEGTQKTPQVSLALAALSVWTLIGSVDMVVLGFTKLPPGGVLLRLTHLFYDFGHMASAGLVAWGLLWLWQKTGLRGWIASLLGYLLLTSSALGMAYLVLPGDLENFAARFDESSAFWHNVFIVLVGLGIPAAALAGRLLRYPYWRWLGLSIAMGIAASNHLVLRRDYAGAHVFLVLAAATLGTSCLYRAFWAHLLLPAVRWSKTRPGRLLRACVALLILLSVFIPPSPPIMSEMLATDSAILVPLVTRVRATARGTASARTQDIIHPDWMSDRKNHPAIEASAPRLVPDDTIIIVISAESMRGDLLSDPRYVRHFPELRTLMRRSLYFPNARSVGSDTRNAIGSLFTSKHYSVLDWKMSKRNELELTNDPTPRWNELLFEHKGMRGFNIVSCSPLVNATSIVRGFQEEKFLKAPKGQKWALAESMTNEAVARLDADASSPLLLLMHWMDAHEPYDAAGTEGEAFDRYVREVQRYDQEVGRLWRYLEQRDLLRRTVLLFVGDHGEAHGEHNIPHHGVSIYDVLLRVPFILYVPGALSAEVQEPVSHVDIGPTMLDLMGVPTPGEYFGQSLVPFLRGERPKLDRPIVADQRTVRSLIVGRHKVMHYRKTNSVELYDIDMDPKETENLFGQRDGLGERMLDAMQDFFETHQVEDTYEYRR